jgi:Arc/MetJ-type ribon-helix-helix transcriptional regulator
LALRFDSAIERAIDALVKFRGTNRSAVIREAILQFLENNEDLESAKKAGLTMEGIYSAILRISPEGLMFREPWKPGMASRSSRMDSCVSRSISPLGRILVNSGE